MKRQSQAVELHATDRVMVGIALGVAAYCLLGAQDASSKLLVARLPVWEVLFFRSLFVLGACAAVGRMKLLADMRRSSMKRALLLRGGVTLASWLAFYTAARALPLGELVTVAFAAPFLVTAMAGPLLGERVTPGRWCSVLLGFAGVLIAVEPRRLATSWATWWVIFAAILWAYAVILMRRIARGEATLVQMAYQNLLFLLGAAALCALGWATPTRGEFPLLAALGVFGGFGQFLLMRAARFAPASVMATVEYSALLWAFALGFLIWGDVPTRSLILGAAIIVASGGLLVVAEQRGGRDRRA